MVLLADLLAFVIACIFAISRVAPSRENVQALAASIAKVAGEERPLFADDEDRKKTAALLVAVSYRESTWTPGIIGDCTKDKAGKIPVDCKVDSTYPHSFCAFQIHDTSGGGPELLTDIDACVRKGIAMLRTSMTVCRAHPIAWYAEGPKGCTSERAQRISKDRMTLASWASRKAKTEP